MVNIGGVTSADLAHMTVLIQTAGGCVAPGDAVNIAVILGIVLFVFSPQIEQIGFTSLFHQAIIHCLEIGKRDILTADSLGWIENIH